MEFLFNSCLNKGGDCEVSKAKKLRTATTCESQGNLYERIYFLWCYFGGVVFGSVVLLKEFWRCGV